MTRHTPLPWEDGAGAYLHDLARYLAGHGFLVDVFWLAPHEHLRWRKLWRLPPMFDRRIRLHVPGGIRLGRSILFPGMLWQPFKARCLGRVRRIGQAIGITRRHRPHPLPSSAMSEPVPRAWASPPTSAELHLVQTFSAKHRPDAVVANYAWMCPVLDLPALRRAQRLCCAPDVGWQRAALAAQGREPPEMSRRDEAAWLQRADTIVAISESDAVALRELAPEAEVIVAPKAVERHAPLAAPDANRLLFVGSDNAFNVAGLDWFLFQVWPQLTRELPGVILDVCGAINRGVTVRPAGVAFHGPVPNLAPYYQRAAVAIVPLLQATGMNIKLIDAVAYGRAVVATPSTLVGVPFLAEAIAVAASAPEFAAAVRSLLVDPAARAAAAARGLATVQARLSPDRCYGPLAACLHEPVSPRPLLSVVMPVFNCRPYLAEAIASVLTQTFAGFELLIVDDGSTDGSAGIMDRAAAADGRIRVLRRANTGIVGALNEGVAAARGELLARMDGDDVALPGRFQAQVDFLLAHPECVAVGTAVEIIDSFGARVDRHHPPTGHVAIVADLLRGNGGALIHPSAVFRTGALHAVGGYDPAFGRAEDLDLYFRLGRYGQLANLAATGLRYRHHARSVSFHHRETQRDQVTRILTREFALRGMPAEPFALHGHTDLSAGQLHARYACTALAHGRRATAVRHGLCAVLHAGADHECWRALRYALTARPPSSRPVL